MLQIFNKCYTRNMVTRVLSEFHQQFHLGYKMGQYKPHMIQHKKDSLPKNLEGIPDLPAGYSSTTQTSMFSHNCPLH